MNVVKVPSSKHRPPLPPRKYSWYSFLLETESSPGPQGGRKDYINENYSDTIGNRTRDLRACSVEAQPTAPLSVPFNGHYPILIILRKNDAITMKYNFTGHWRNIVLSAGVRMTRISLNPLTFSCLMTYIYMSYRTANLQMLHYIYLFNKYMYWIF